MKNGGCLWGWAGLLALWIAAPLALASDWFVAVDGRSDGDGSWTRPWNLNTALIATNTVAPGDVVWLRAGEYVGLFECALKGNEFKTVTVRALPGGRCAIIGTISQDVGGWVTFWGMEVCQKPSSRWTDDSGSAPTNIPTRDAIIMRAPGMRFINLVVHDALGDGFALWSEAPDAEVYGCLIYNNGWKGPDRGHGHGIYLQNQTGTKIIRHNLVFNQFGNGIQVYGTSEAFLNRIDVSGNIAFDNGSLAETTANNITISGGTPARGITVTSNATYHLAGKAGTVQLGAVGVASWDLTASHNYFAEFVRVSDWTGILWTNNTVISPGTVLELDQTIVPMNEVSLDWDFNRYYQLGTNAWPFSLVTTQSHGYSYDEWQSFTGLDQHTPVTNDRPSENEIVVRSNMFEPGRAWVAIYNWQLASTVNWNPAGILAPGSRYRVFNAQNMAAPLADAVWDGQPLSFDMTVSEVAQAVGWTNPSPVTAPEFQVFQIVTCPMPHVAALSNQWVAPGATYAAAIESEYAPYPRNLLVYSLDPGAPPDAVISSNGVLEWPVPPGAAPGFQTIPVRVANLQDTNWHTIMPIQVEVLAVTNDPPVLAPPVPAIIPEMIPFETTLSVINPPALGVRFSLLAAPDGVVLNPSNGLLQWTPSENQAPQNHTIFYKTTDALFPTLSSTGLLEVTVEEINQRPILAVPPDVSVREMTTLVLTNQAFDADIPANTLTFSLVSAPAGVQLDPDTGILTWTPSEFQGPGVFSISIAVTDDGLPSLGATQTFAVTVKEANSPPNLSVSEDVSMDELTAFVFTNRTTDPDIPADILLFSLVSAPAGVQLDPTTGILVWTPTEAQGPGVYRISIAATDNGLPSLSVTQSFSITVRETNSPPQWPPPPEITLHEQSTLVLTNQALDVDIPTNTLTYSLASAPVGVQLDSTTGVLTWTPTETQGPGIHWIAIAVTDNGSPSLSATQILSVTVREANSAPVLAPPPYVAMNELTTLLLTMQASDSDVPANKLTFSVISAPSGLQLDPTTGVLSWTPSEAQGPGTHSITLAVTDNGSPSLSATQRFSAIVHEVNTAPVLSTVPDVSVNELATLVITNRAIDPDIPANTLTFTLISAPEGVQLDSASGVLTWTPTEAQGPGSYPITVMVRDNGSPSLTDTQSFNVTVKESNQVPVLNAPQDISMNELTTLLLTLQVSDSDVPANKLTFSVISAPSGLQLDPTTGVLSWTPSEAQGPATHSITLAVTDNGSPSLSATQRFSVVVQEVNAAPVLSTVPDVSVNELTTLVITNRATDPDLPANTLTFSLVSAPEGVQLDSTSGVLTWTPTETQGPGSYPITILVRDNGSPSLTATQSFNVTVKESNQAPVLNAPQDISMNELTTLLLTLQASDSDVPANKLAFSVISAPSGLQLDPTTGVLSWTPSEAQGPATHSITLAVTDNGSPSLSATQRFSVIVHEVNTAPVLSAVPDVSVNELATLVITNRAIDPDLPANPLTFSLVSAPEGVQLDSTSGVLTWTPTEVQGPGSYPITVMVRDNGSPSLTDSQSFNVTVKESNQAPVLNAPQDISMNELTTLLLTLQASDSDVPANKLAFSVISAPIGLQLDPTTGVLSWTPSEAQGPATHSITLAVTDNGSPSLSTTQRFSVIVHEVNTAPYFTQPSEIRIDAMIPWAYTVRVFDDDLPLNSITLGLLESPEGMILDPDTDLLQWTPPSSEAGQNRRVLLEAHDNAIPPLTARLEIPIAINPITPVTLYFLQNENRRLLRVTGNPRLPYTIEYAASLVPPVGWQLVTVTNPGLSEITLTNLDLPGMSCFFRARQP